MKRYKLNLETMGDINHFLDKARVFPKDELRISDGNKYEVSAQSMLGLLYSLEWREIYLYSVNEDPAVYDTFAEFVID